MIGTLKKEGADDVAKRDQCKDEYQKIESKVKNVTWLLQKNVAKIDKLEKLIAMREEQKQQTTDELNDLRQRIMPELRRVREAENTAFTHSKSEDQQAIDLLIGARSALLSYYRNHSIAMGPIQGSVKGLVLAQQPDFDVSADQAPDTVFSGKGKRKSEAKGIVQILTTIIEDLNDEIKNSMKAEEEAQLEFEKQMDSAERLSQQLSDKILSLRGAIAKRGEEKTAEEEDKIENEGDLNDEQTYKASITNDCDFIIRTFEKRAAARSAEISGLVGAKEYLAGFQQQKEGAFIEKKPLHKRTFDDHALSRMNFLGVEK